MKITRIVLLALFVAGGGFAGCAHQPSAVGGFITASTSREDVVMAAEFAVHRRSRTEKRPLRLVKVAQAREQVVAGKNYELSLLVNDGERDRAVEAVVWWQAWRKEEPYQLVAWKWQ